MKSSKLFTKQPMTLPSITSKTNEQTVKPPISIYQRNGRASITTTGVYGIGKYAEMPYFNFNPVVGIPRLVNTQILRNLANTIWAGVPIKTICTEVSETPWKIKVKEGFEENSKTKERARKITEFYKMPNTNGESMGDLTYKICYDYLVIGDGAMIKVFYDSVNKEKTFNELNYKGYHFENDEGKKITKSSNLNEQSILKTSNKVMQKLTTYVPENYLKYKTTDKGGNLYELWPVDSSTLLINADSEGKLPVNEPAYWQYNHITPRNGPRPFFKREVIWIKNMPRSDSVYGWSPLLNALSQIECLEGGTRFNQKIFENMSRPDAIVSLEGADKETCDQASQFWIDKFQQNPHKILFVGEPHNVTKLNMNNQEMEWLEGQKLYFKFMLALLNVTPDEIGLSDESNRLTGPHQSRVFIRKAIQPLLNKLRNVWNTQVIPEWYEPGEEVDLEFEYYFDDETQKQLILDNALKEVSAGTLTINEHRLSQGRDEVSWGDEPLRIGMPSSNPGAQTSYSNNTEKEQVSKEVTELLLKKKFEIPSYKGIVEFFKVFFGTIRNEVLKLFDRIHSFSDFYSGVSAITSVDFDYDKISKVTLDDYSQGVKEAEQSLNFNSLESIPSEAVKESTRQLIDGMTLGDGGYWHGIRGTNMKLGQAIINSVREGSSKGEKINDLKKRVTELLDANDSRTETIARTESQRFFNLGQFETAMHSGIPNLKKRWHAVHDNKTADDSLRLDGQVKNIDEPFIDPLNGREIMLPPGDHPNSRCWVEYFKDDELKKKFDVTEKYFYRDHQGRVRYVPDWSKTATKSYKEIPKEQLLMIRQFVRDNNKGINSQTNNSKEGIYNDERKKLHEDIINNTLNSNATKRITKSNKPLAVILAGSPASGKTKVLKTLYNSDDFTIIDPDMNKNKLPEYNGLNASYVHEESSDIAKEIQKRALNNNHNIIIDGTLKNKDKAVNLINELKSRGYEVEIQAIYLPEEKAIERALSRFKEEGRFVDFRFIGDVGSKIKDSVESVKSNADYYSIWSTDIPKGEKPILLESNK